jgi:hypothetical protein
MMVDYKVLSGGNVSILEPLGAFQTCRTLECCSRCDLICEFLLAKAFLAAASFAVVFERAGFPLFGDLKVVSGLLGESGDVHEAEAVVERGDVVGIADSGVVFLVGEGFGEML